MWRLAYVTASTAHYQQDVARAAPARNGVHDLARQCQLAWLGHVGGEDDDRLVKQATFSWIPVGVRRNYGSAPRQTFAGARHKALKQWLIHGISWYDRAKDRNSWREIVVYGIREKAVGSHCGKIFVVKY